MLISRAICLCAYASVFVFSCVPVYIDISIDMYADACVLIAMDMSMCICLRVCVLGFVCVSVFCFHFLPSAFVFSSSFSLPSRLIP